jgi:hypothetical protein
LRLESSSTRPAWKDLAVNRLGLRELLQRYADEQWVAVPQTPEQAAESVLDCFKRAVRQELELLELKCQLVQ